MMSEENLVDVGGSAPAVNKPKIGQKVNQVAGYYKPSTWKQKGLWWTLGLFLVTYGIVVGALGIYWSRSPSAFDPREQALAVAQNDQNKLKTGYTLTATAIRIAETMLDKPGGYLSNDITPPGVYLDNIPEWEFGVLTEMRDLTRSLRNEFTRSQTQSTEDRDLQVAEPQFNFDSSSWILPSTESEYRKGIDALYRYLNRLGDDQAGDGNFFARADNLSLYLQVVEKRLGSYAQRLAASVGRTSFNRDLAGDPNARQAQEKPEQTVVKTPWVQLDNIFFETRGYAWALLHTLKAVEYDFHDVLAGKNAVVSLKQIIRELESTQDFIWSPVILNGMGFALVANHSLVMASYISRANAAIIDLRNLLLQG